MPTHHAPIVTVGYADSKLTFEPDPLEVHGKNVIVIWKPGSSVESVDDVQITDNPGNPTYSSGKNVQWLDPNGHPATYKYSCTATPTGHAPVTADPQIINTGGG